MVLINFFQKNRPCPEVGELEGTPSKSVDLIRFYFTDFIAIFLLSVLETLVYIHFFAVSSGAGVQHLAEVSRGISLSLILTSSVFGPIQEELIFRGLLQGAVFDNSWLGLVLTSSLFSFMHGPSNVPSFIFYLLGGVLLGFAYKKSQNLWVSTLVHMFYNSWPLLYYL